MNKQNVLKWMAPSVLIICAGSVIAGGTDITVDGTRAGDPYDTTASVTQASKAIDEILAGPVSGSADSDNTVPIGGEGVGEYGGSALNGPTADVMTGYEARYNLEFLGWNGTDPINLAGWINGGNFLSNQVIGTIDPVQQGNLGSGGVTFSLMAGDQFVTVGATASADITVDGSIDMTEASDYALLYAQETFTQFGDNNNPDPIVNSGGSEIDNVYAYVSDPNGSLPTVDGDEWLNVFMGGNAEGNGNNITLWIDVDAAAGIDTGFGGGGVSNLGDLAGNTLDIDAEWGVQYNRNSGGSSHYFALAQQDGGAFGGSNGNSALPGVGAIEDGMMNTIAEVTFDDSNVLGVAGGEFSGGFGGSDMAAESDPALDTAGVEICVNLSDLGYDPMDGFDGMGGGVRVAGFIIEANAVSNQVLGGLPADTAPLDAVAGVNFDTISGDQFVIVSDTSMTAPIVDGVKDMSYGATEYVNNVDGTGNATNRTSPQGPTVADDDPMGSEINNFSGVLVEQGGDWYLYAHTGGALGNFDRLYLYVDFDSTDGENQLSGLNPNIDNDQANNAAGLTFDAGFTADALFVYRTGTDMDTMNVTHFFDGVHITTGAEDTEVSGSFGGGPKSDGAISGSIVARRGFGNNGDNTKANSTGDELDGLFAYLEDRNPTGGGAEPYVTLMLTGNLKPVFNKVDIYLDVDPSFGQNTLIWDGDLMTGVGTDDSDFPTGAYVGNPPVDFSALQSVGGPFPDLGTMDPMDTIPGLTFDAGFEPDHFITLTIGNLSAGTDGIDGTADDDAELYVNFARLRDPGVDGLFDADNMGDDEPGIGLFLGQGAVQAPNPSLSTTPSWQIAVDNSNVSGVPGGVSSFGITPVQSLVIGAVMTGIEISFPAGDFILDPDGTATPWNGQGQMGIHAMLVNSGHTFISSQTLPPVCNDELGDPRRVDFSDDATYPDQQHIFLEASSAEQAYTVVAGQDFLTAAECVEPVGACCMGDACSVMTVTACEGMSGEFLGDGTDCGMDPEDNPCLSVQACCFADNSCLPLNSVQCMLASGTFIADALCTDLPDPCAPVNDCAYDVNNTGAVDIVDFTAFSMAFNSMVGDPNYDPALDFNNTGTIDIVDFTEFSMEFGRTDCLD